MSVGTTLLATLIVATSPAPERRISVHLPESERGRYNATVLDEVIRAPTWPPRQ